MHVIHAHLAHLHSITYYTPSFCTKVIQNIKIFTFPFFPLQTFYAMRNYFSFYLIFQLFIHFIHLIYSFIENLPFLRMISYNL